MPLPIETFSNVSGGTTLFKALGHPLANPDSLLQKIRSASRPAVYDPLDQLATFAALHGLEAEEFRQCFVRDTLSLQGQTPAQERPPKRTPSQERLPVTDLPDSNADLLFVPAFDCAPLLAQIRHLLPADCAVVSLDEMRIPDRLLTSARHYLDKLNFATNFAFFRDQKGRHSRLSTANYWGGYGAEGAFLWCRLFAADGSVLTDFEVPLGEANASLVIDSRQLRTEHGLGEFCGQLFVSVIRGAGHDVVKYVLDSGGEEEDLSCTHDANAWPSDLYAGLPAPAADEQVLLWVQNSHPTAIPAGEIGLNRMGDDRIAWLDEAIAPFASRALDVRELLPDVCWPQQVEIQAGKWMVRPRYEVIRGGRRRINHPNVERSDLSDDRAIRDVARHLGKGFILPAPLLPPDEYRSECLPTPMSTAQISLPLETLLYDAAGNLLARQSLGNLPRDHSRMLDLNDWLADLPADLPTDSLQAGGHVELIYDMQQPNACMDGWLHALFRYTDKQSGHAADTSFGAHLFNHIMTFRSEPQSYKGPPPGLSTRLFLRLLPSPMRVFCQLIYPVCDRWHDHSDTLLQLHDAAGKPVAQCTLAIPANGSRLFFVDSLFDAGALQQAGESGYILVRDSSCRLFGYHGVRHNSGFALDHMFGF